MKSFSTPTNPGRWFGTVLAATSLLIAGCGGSDPATPDAGAGEQVASVQITETASGLSVKSTLPTNAAARGASGAAPTPGNGAQTESGDDGTSVTQAVQFTFTATNADKTSLLQGLLALRAESDGTGATELEGRFAPAAAAASAPSAAPSADAIAAFQAAKTTLKAALRSAVDQARSAFEAAVAADPAAKAAARARFRADVATAVNTFRADLAKAAADAGVALGGRDAGREAARRIEVEGSFDAAAKTVTLESRQRGGLARIVFTGTGTLESGFAGTFATTLNGTAVTGDWQAMPSAATAPTVPLPPPTPPAAGACARQTVTWSVSGANCSASFAGGPSGTSAGLTNALVGSTGTVTATCNNGVVATANPVCTVNAPPSPAPAPTPTPSGNVAAGLALYNGKCAGCHGTSKANASAARTATGLAAVMQSVGSHAGVGPTLSAQDLLDLSAYIASAK
jgi:hypothetical protein